MKDLISRKAAKEMFLEVPIPLAMTGKCCAAMLDDLPSVEAEPSRSGGLNYKETLEITNAKLAEVEHHLSNVLDERTKIGIEYEQALIRIDELNGKIEFLKGQIEAYQYCMNCRR